MSKKQRRAYPSVQAWMEATRTPSVRLAKLTGIDPSLLSRILTGSRRCSLVNALKLHETTGVPVENLVRWLASDRKSIVERSVKTEGEKCA